jgi:hypothetical protein
VFRLCFHSHHVSLLSSAWIIPIPRFFFVRYFVHHNFFVRCCKRPIRETTAFHQLADVWQRNYTNQIWQKHEMHVIIILLTVCEISSMTRR